MTNRINRIIITGDVFRPEPNQKTLGNQDPNIRWFHDLFEFYIKRTIPNIEVHKLLSNDKTQKFSANEFYELLKLDISYNNWAQLYHLNDFNRKIENYLLKHFEQSFVIGFELPDILKKFFDKNRIHYLEFVTHPVRFLDDIFFGIDSNSNIIKDKLIKYQIDENEIYAISNLRKAGLRRLKKINIKENSALLIGQTNVDRSLIFNGRIKNIFDYQKELEIMANTFDNIYFKPHPYQKDRKKVKKYLNKYNAMFVDQNVYYLLCQRDIKKVYAISSSVIEEAKYFDVESEYFQAGIRYTKIPVFNNYFDSKFWIDMLGTFFSVNDKFNVKIPDKSNRLRDNIGWYWGFHIFEFENLLRDVKRQNKNVYNSIINKIGSQLIQKK